MWNDHKGVSLDSLSVAKTPQFFSVQFDLQTIAGICPKFFQSGFILADQHPKDCERCLKTM